MAVMRQNSFSGGMLSPSLEGRTDYAKRLAGARRIHNFFVTPYGTLRRRPGIRLISHVYGTGGLSQESIAAITNGLDVEAKLLRFRGTGGADALIVLSHRSGAVLVGASLLNDPKLRFRTPWNGRDLRTRPERGVTLGLKYSQSGQRLLVTHPAYAPHYIYADDAGQWQAVQAELTTDDPAATAFTADYVAAED